MSGKATRKIVHIDEDKCDGCGMCVPNCMEGAIEVIDGKARLIEDKLCDGLGNCLGVCPKDAIKIEERPADDFDEEAVKERIAALEGAEEPEPQEEMPCGCPGAMARKLAPQAQCPSAAVGAGARQSALGQWPVQLALLPEKGQVWKGADVLLSADCVPFAMAGFHEELLAGKTLAIACPKLDDTNAYASKLSRVFSFNDIKSITVARMEVPCCGLDHIVETAVKKSARDVPVTVVTVGVSGNVLETVKVK